MKKGSTKRLMQLTLLSSVGAILMLFQFPIFAAAPYLKLELSDIPVLIAGFAFGPMAGLLVLAVKNLIFSLIRFNPVELIGIPMNTIATGALVLVASYIYHKKKTWSNALMGLFSGLITMVLVMIPANYVITPILFEYILHQPAPANLIEIIIYFIVPFNVIKGILSGALTFLVYKRTSRFIRPDVYLKSTSSDSEASPEPSVD